MRNCDNVSRSSCVAFCGDARDSDLNVASKRGEENAGFSIYEIPRCGYLELNCNPESLRFHFGSSIQALFWLQR